MSPKLLTVARVTSLVVPMTVTVILGFFVGNWLDEKVGSSPIFLLLFGLGGLVVGFHRMLNLLNRNQGDDNTEG